MLFKVISSFDENFSCCWVDRRLGPSVKSSGEIYLVENLCHLASFVPVERDTSPKVGLEEDPHNLVQAAEATFPMKAFCLWLLEKEETDCSLNCNFVTGRRREGAVY